MTENVEIISGGLKCDNPKCDWRDDTIAVDTYAQWVDKPCPKCGENLLTEEDYRNAQTLLSVAHLMNSMTKEEIELLSTGYDEKIEESPMFKDAKGLDNLKGDGGIIVKWETHKEIKVSEIKKANERQ